MFPGPDALPEVLRLLAPEPIKPPAAPVVEHPPHETLVDCAVYVEGNRLPGKVTYAAAPQDVSNFAFAAPADATPVCITDPNLPRMPWQPPSN